MSTDSRILASLVKHMKAKGEDPLTPLVEEYLIKRDLPRFRGRRVSEYLIPPLPAPRPPGRFSPSKICGCERQAAFSFMGVEGRKRTDPEGELTMESGNWHHHKWQWMFTDMEAVLGRNRFRCLHIEQRIEIEDLYVSGTLDVIIAIKIDGKWIKFVVDIKTINRRGFDWVYQKREPKEAHVKQLYPYMKAKKIRRGIILYECRDDARFYPFYVDFDQKQWREVVQWCENVAMKMHNHEIPPMASDCDHGNFLYDRCVYRSMCWSESGRRKMQEVYVNFPGVEQIWEEGNEAIRASA